METLALLVNDNNIGGAWTVIAAVIAVFGIYIKNLFESKREKKTREYDALRVSYTNAIEYLAHLYHQILTISSGKELHLEEKHIKTTQHFYHIFLMASPNVIHQFTEIASAATSILLVLSEQLISLQKLKSDLDNSIKDTEIHLNRMNELNREMENFNLSGNHDVSFWNSLQESFTKTQEDFDFTMQKREDLIKNIYVAEISLLKSGIRNILDVSPKIYSCIFFMRKDVERKLNSKEMKIINTYIEKMLEEVETSFTNFINNVDKRVELEEAQ